MFEKIKKFFKNLYEKVKEKITNLLEKVKKQKKAKKRNNSKKFVVKPVKITKKETKDDLKTLYEHAYKELSLQQTKRDQLITLYISICTFLLPISYSIERLSNIRGYLFGFLGLIGAILAGIINRYRVYKEVYWLSCITISQLFNYKEEDVDDKKELIQQLFYDSMEKKGQLKEKFYDKKKKRFCWLKYGVSLFFSAETLYYVLETVVTSLFLSLGVLLVFKGINPTGAVVSSILVFVTMFILFYISYCRNVFLVYRVLLDKKDKSFNSTFEKAWFLFIYYENSNSRKEISEG